VAKYDSSKPLSEAWGTTSSPAKAEGSIAALDNSHESLLPASTGQPVMRILDVRFLFANTLYGARSLLPELVNRWGAQARHHNHCPPGKRRTLF